MPLQEHHVTSWRHDGFLRLSMEEVLGCKAEEAVQQMTAEVAAMQEWPETPGKWMMYFEESLKDKKRLLNRIEKFLDYVEEGSALMRIEAALRGICTELEGEEAVLFKEKINLKHSGGGGFEPHQDYAAGWDRYGHTDFISVLVAVDAQSAGNGQLEVVAQEHTKGLLGPMEQAIPAELVEKMEWIGLDLQPGEVVLFGAFTPHRSAPNLSDSSRRALYLTYNKLSDGQGEVRQRYYADKRAAFPPDCERDPSKTYAYKI